MRLTSTDALARLAAHEHGVLCTVHVERGPDPVPVVYASDGAARLGIPIDRVKPKASTRLQRERNLELDRRASLLVEHWDRTDWSRLWWVRAELRWIPETEQRDGEAEALASLLADRVPQYRDRPFERVLVFEIVSVAGWSAAVE